MRMPAPDDTIVAISSGWSAAPVGIVRLSGPDAGPLLARLGLTPAGRGWIEGRIALDGCRLPATVFWFPRPRSYTGQDVAEIHTVGQLPLLRRLAERLIELGARRALPGEFTARALLAGKLGARQVEGVLALMRAQHEADVRRAARLARDEPQRQIGAAVERLTGLLARIEAGIDFTDEEDVRFITAADAAAALDEVAAALAAAAAGPGDERRGGQPHVALVGLPNAGKSTLFNALLGRERALVSPVLGTTRDVLSAEIEVGGRTVVLQDCAGLGSSPGELELATYRATERAARRADLVAWVQAADTPWDPRAAAVCTAVPVERRVLVRSKTDLAAGSGHVPASMPAGGGGAAAGAADGEGSARAAVPLAFAAEVRVCALSGAGLAELRAALAASLEQAAAPAECGSAGADTAGALAAVRRARALVASGGRDLAQPELLSLELREALAALEDAERRPLDEELLGRIFAEFCVGK